jgi:hypothetical protein
VSTPAALHKAIICVDIEGFNDPRIADWQRTDMRAGLYGALERAFGNSRIPWDECYSEDRGDGAFFLIRPDVPKARLVDPLPYQLAAELGRHNQTADVRIRLRVAMHAGDVRVEEKGVVGSPLNQAFRLLDAPTAKAALREAPGDLVLIASESVYREVITQRRGLDLSSYRRVRVAVKETDVPAWICTSDVQLRAGEAVGRIETTVAAIGEVLDKARRERAATVAKIASAVPDIPDLVTALRDRRAALEELRKEHRWSELADAVAELERATDGALARARAARRDAGAPLEQREELRGLLASYQAMAREQGRVEHRHLDELYRQAYALLRTVPCDLPVAEVATMSYVRAVAGGAGGAGGAEGADGAEEEQSSS